MKILLSLLIGVLVGTVSLQASESPVTLLSSMKLDSEEEVRLAASERVVLFEDDFTEPEMSEAWTLDERPFDLSEESEANGVFSYYIEQGVILDYQLKSGNWGGGAYLSTTGYTASVTKPLIFEIRRSVYSLLGEGARCSVLIYQGDGSERRIHFSDMNEGEHQIGWCYNRLSGESGDNPVGTGIVMETLQQEELLNYGDHTVKMVVNGVSVDFYVDDILGASIDFPVTEDIHFGFGVYAQEPDDMTYAIFQEASISQEIYEEGFPIITTQPLSQKAKAGETIALSVEARNAEFYQWYKDETAIEGATNAVLQLEAISQEDAGSYLVEVGNDLGTVNSVPATVTVISSPAGEVSLEYTYTEESLILSFTGTLQVSEDGINWSDLTSAQSPYTVKIGEKSRQFFRAVN